jgi:hypothetical protein
MSALKVCDYLSLYILDAELETTTNSLTYKWTIPNSYYTDQRSQVCSVEITAGALECDDSKNINSLAIAYMNNGSFNQYSSKTILVGAEAVNMTKATAPVIGYGYNLYTGITAMFQAEGSGALLCNARPQTIYMKFIKTNKTEVLENDNLTGCLTLKYLYYNALDTARRLQDENTMHM